MLFSEKLDKNKNNPHKTWKTIKSLLHINKESFSTINKIVVDDNEISETTSLQLLIILLITLLMLISSYQLAQTYADQDK